MAAHPTPVLGNHGAVVFLAVRQKHPDFSARAFAAFAGVSIAHLSEIENGTKPLGLDLAATLARYLSDPDVVFADTLLRCSRRLSPLDDTPPARAEEIAKSALQPAAAFVSGVLAALADGKLTEPERRQVDGWFTELAVLQERWMRAVRVLEHTEA